MAGWRIGFAVGNQRLIARAGARQILSRLRRLHPDPGRRDRGAQRPAGLHRRDPRALQGAPRRAGRRAAAGRLGHSGARRASMFAWAPIPEEFRSSAASASRSCCSSAPMSRSRPASASANTARGLSASRWSRTASACARRRATSRPSCRDATTRRNCAARCAPRPRRRNSSGRWGAPRRPLFPAKFRVGLTQAADSASFFAEKPRRITATKQQRNSEITATHLSQSSAIYQRHFCDGVVSGGSSFFSPSIRFRDANSPI